MIQYIFYFLVLSCIASSAQEISLQQAINKSNLNEVANYLQNNPKANLSYELLHADNRRALKAVKLNEHIERPYMQLSRCNKIVHIAMLAACIYMFYVFIIHMGKALYKDHKVRNRLSFQHTLQTLQEIPNLCMSLASLYIIMLYQKYMKEKLKDMAAFEHSQAASIYNLIVAHQKQFDPPVLSAS